MAATMRTVRVLLVDDDDDHALLAVDALLGSTEARFIVDRADSGAAALKRVAGLTGDDAKPVNGTGSRDATPAGEAAAGEAAPGATVPYDALVLDYRLHDEDGLALLERLRLASVDAPALLLTSHGSEAVAARALRAKADEYLPKQEGLAGDALARAVLAMLERRRLADELAKAREQAARLQGVLLAASTIEHHISNQLARTVGYAELLAISPRLPVDLRARANLALQGAMEAVATLRKLRAVMQLREIALPAGSSLLDLEGSTKLDRDA